jgi:hypothetical protein
MLTLAVLALPAAASVYPEDTAWNPVASERLIKLPGSYLKKAVENDFRGSGLAASIRDTESLIDFKAETLADLQGAIEQSDGELKIELQHQFLAEKRDYLELVGRHQDLRRKQMTTKQRLYRKLLAKLGRQKNAMTPGRQALIEKQVAAWQRLERSIAQVDLKLFSTPMLGQSKYAKDYANNVAAIERLVQSVNAHPMNGDATLDGQSVSKKQYLQHLAGEAEGELQIIDQEEAILGYMAKLIALDALALTEQLTDTAELADEEDRELGLAAAVDFFITQ